MVFFVSSSPKDEKYWRFFSIPQTWSMAYSGSMLPDFVACQKPGLWRRVVPCFADLVGYNKPGLWRTVVHDNIVDDFAAYHDPGLWRTVLHACGMCSIP